MASKKPSTIPSKKGRLTREIVWLDPDDCADNWWNPNKETAETFNLLYESIDDLGLVENIQVVPLVAELEEAFNEDEDKEKVRELINQGKKWLILHGSHRFEAARLAGKEALPEIPAVILEPTDVYRKVAMAFRMNNIKGQWDLDTLPDFYNKLARNVPGWGEQTVRDMMGVSNQKELQKLIDRTKKDLPPEMQQALEAAREEIKSIDDLSKVLNTLFSRYGEDLTYGFMTFTWGGKIHTMIRLTKDTNQMLAHVKQFAREQNVDMNNLLVFAFRHILGADEQEWPEPLERDLSIAE